MTLRLAVVVACALSIGCGAYVNARYPLTPLAAAARAGDIGEVDRLIASGAAIDTGSGVNDWPPALHAIHKGQAAVLAHLLDRGATLDTSTARNAVQLAGGNSAILRVLRAHGIS